jgi:hypothetical protein
MGGMQLCFMNTLEACKMLMVGSVSIILKVLLAHAKDSGFT